jgi:Set1/Ash2 histone methyltransferase complex subunit ASH2
MSLQERVLSGHCLLGYSWGRYYPAASMYMLPNEPNCVVKFNFGPDFDYFQQDFCGMPIPQPIARCLIRRMK